MKILKYLVLSLFTAILFLSCEKNNTSSSKADPSKKMVVTSLEKEKETEYYKYSIDIPQISNSDSEDTTYFNMSMQENSRNIIENMATSDQEGEFRSAYVNYKAYDSSFDVLSIVVTSELDYVGSAHPTHSVESFIFSNKTHSLISMNTLLNEDDIDYFNMLINDHIRDKKTVYNTQGEECMLFDDAEANVKDSTIYFDGNNMVFLFPEYYLSPYSSGIPMFKFEKSVVKKYIHLNN